jgi:hypothetical protein
MLAILLIALLVAVGMTTDDNRVAYSRAEVFAKTRIDSGLLSRPSDDHPDVPDVVGLPEGCKGLLLISEDAIEANPDRRNTVAVEDPGRSVRVLVYQGQAAPQTDCEAEFRKELRALP